VKKFKLQVAKKDKEITQLNEKLHNQSKIQHQMVGGGGFIFFIKYTMASFHTLLPLLPRHELELMLCSSLPPHLPHLPHYIPFSLLFNKLCQPDSLQLLHTSSRAHFAFPPFLNAQAAEVKELHETKSKLDRRDKEISILNAKLEEQV
jgi:hypothetical protein